MITIFVQCIRIPNYFPFSIGFYVNRLTVGVKRQARDYKTSESIHNDKYNLAHLNMLSSIYISILRYRLKSLVDTYLYLSYVYLGIQCKMYVREWLSIYNVAIYIIIV